MNDSSATAPMLTEERDGTTIVLTLNNPQRRNALAMPLREGLIAAFERIEADRAIRAVVLTGAGGTFCAGGDITAMNVKNLADGLERFRITHASAGAADDPLRQADRRRGRGLCRGRRPLARTMLRHDRRGG